MNIYEKMLAITQEISTVAKNLQVGEGKAKYKAVGEADVLAAVKPIEAKHGVYSYPAKRSVIDSGEMTSVQEYNGQRKESKRLFLRIETVYRFVNVEKPEEFIDIVTYGDGVDTQDKAPGKAMTYSDKYGLLKAYKIQTGDDPDQTASDPLEGVKKATIGSVKAQALSKALQACGQSEDKIMAYYKVTSLAELTEAQHYQIMEKVNGHNR